MDEYSATDHSVILTQQGEEGGGEMQKQTVQLQHMKKKNKSFHENMSGACVFMWNDSSPPLQSYRETKGGKTPKVQEQTLFREVWSSGVRLHSLLSLSSFNISTVQACVGGRTLSIYLHVVMSAGLLFVPALFNVELVPPPVLADSRICRRAMLAAPTLRGWIRCVCYGERWLMVGSTEAGWALERAASCHSRSLTLLCSQGLLLHV